MVTKSKKRERYDRLDMSVSQQYHKTKILGEKKLNEKRPRKKYLYKKRKKEKKKTSAKGKTTVSYMD